VLNFYACSSFFNESFADYKFTLNIGLGKMSKINFKSNYSAS